MKCPLRQEYLFVATVPRASKPTRSWNRLTIRRKTDGRTRQAIEVLAIVATIGRVVVELVRLFMR